MKKMIKSEKGTSLMETVVALAIFSIVMLSTALYISTALTSTRSNFDRTYCTQKALQMMNELRAYVESGAEQGTAVLDSFDNGTVAVPVLTTLSNITDPDAESSGNIDLGGRWKYARLITVRRIPDSPNSKDVRFVTVKVYLTNENSSTDTSQMMPLAEIGGDVRTVSESFPPSQVYDIYLLALDNVPGWWNYMVTIKPLVENAIQEMESRNPGLVFRTHWITKLAYGRDKEYLPYVNETNDSRAAIDYVYFYPGKMPDPASNSDVAATHYYVANRFGGRVNVDGAILNDYDNNPVSITYNPYPYSIADQYNHAMRYHDELELFTKRVESGQEDEEEPTLRLLLEEMAQNPDKFKNALFINLHGELVPFPPVRNYADPAKDPEGLPGVRVVTHPTQIRFRNTEDVQLRVYAYLGEPTKYNSTYAFGSTTAGARAYNDQVKEIKIQIPLPEGYSTPIAASDVEVYYIYGGIDADGDSNVDTYPDSWQLCSPSASYPGDNIMGCKIDTNWNNPDTSSVTEQDLLITLYNTPLKCKFEQVGAWNSGRGLWDTSTGNNSKENTTLYGLYYIPSPVVANTATTRNFRDIYDNRGGADIRSYPKNTARWLIIINDIDSGGTSDSLPENGYLKINTHIGDGVTTTDHEDLRGGVLFPSRYQPTNISTAYTWIEDIPPVTERYQFLGDPRHHPYVDQEAPYDATNNPLGMGYNRYWDRYCHDPDRDSADEYPGYNLPSANGWDNKLAIDVARLFQIWREGLLGARAIFNTMTGYSFYYVGIGNEIGYDAANNFPNSIPVSNEPFTGGGGDGYEQSIISGDGGSKWIVESDESWIGLHWLGELFPDDQYVAHWKDDRVLSSPLSIGNLPTGSSSNTFIRESRNDIDYAIWGARIHYPDEMMFDWEPQRRTSTKGCASFYNGTSSSAPFNHIFRDGAYALIQTAGEEMSDAYNYPLPDDMEAWRPFGLDQGGNTPPEWNMQPWQSERNFLALIQTFYLQGSDQSSSIVRMDDGTDTSKSCYMVVNGLSPAGVEGTNLMARFSVISVLHGFFEGGLSTTNRVVQMPRIWITEPDPSDLLENPGNIDIKWSTDWKKWNGEKYTSSYADSFSETETLSFFVIYSDDGGSTWKYVLDGSSATLGEIPRDANGVVIATLKSSGGQEGWSTGSLPQGTYFIRVECYRDNYNLHYSYHQSQIYIKR
jgi:Tfp pilus assembly protein PilV